MRLGENTIFPGKHFKKSQTKHKEFGNAVGFVFQAQANKILRSDVSMNVQRIKQVTQNVN